MMSEECNEQTDVKAERDKVAHAKDGLIQRLRGRAGEQNVCEGQRGGAKGDWGRQSSKC